MLKVQKCISGNWFDVAYTTHSRATTDARMYYDVQGKPRYKHRVYDFEKRRVIVEVP